MFGTIGLLAGLALIPAATPDGDLYTMPTRDLEIPIHVSPDRADTVKALRLWVSADEGKTWKPTSAVDTQTRSFGYHAPGDGLYWFALQVVLGDGSMEPADESRLTPLLKVAIRAPAADKSNPSRRTATAEEVEELRSRVQQLEKRLLELEKRRNPKDAPVIPIDG